ncbi:MAG TPA: squalene/phytoene synthase family protein [Stellaceae bacterium]|nr:squalene/phytoene synthase family protein [Stellaceae bacterium]
MLRKLGGVTSVYGQRSSDPSLSPAAAITRRHDRDRFQTALFAPATHREALFALYAFNYEIARVRESVSQPTLGRIRLEWWRENIAAAFDGGPVRRHDIVEAVSSAVRDRKFTRGHFDRMIDARQADFDDDPPANLAALEDYAEATSSCLIYLALEVLGVDDPAAREAAHHIGIAYALAGLLRAMPHLSANGRPVIPVDIAARHRLDPYGWREAQGSPALRDAVAEIAEAAAGHLRAARSPRSEADAAALPALLLGVIAGHALKRLKRAEYNPFDPALARADPLQSWRLAAAMLRHRF